MSMKFRTLALAAFGLALMAAASAAQNCPPQWAVGQFRAGGVNGKVNVALRHDDGSGPALYLGGSFTTAGGVPSPYLTRLRAGQWESVGVGVSGEIFALQVFDDGSGPALYAGGMFSVAGMSSISNIARWDGSAWSALGSGVVGAVRSLAVGDLGSGPRLFLGGDFVTAGGNPAARVAVWDGTSFAPLGAGVGGGGSPTVVALELFAFSGAQLSLVAAGTFTSAGGTPASNIARWTGTAWSPLGPGLNAPASALKVATLGASPPVLYATGSFTVAGGGAASRIARFNGSAWSGLGSGLVGGVGAALAVHDFGAGPRLVVGGTFVTAGGLAVDRIASYDGAAWSSVGVGLQCSACPSGITVSALATDGVELFAGGTFASSGSNAVSNVAAFDGTSWNALSAPTGPVGTVLAIETFDDGTGAALYFGGTLASAGTLPVSRIAKWDGTAFSAVGAGTDGTISALESFDDGGGAVLYAGGTFQNAGGVPAAGVASYDGSTWSALGSGLTGGGAAVNALHGFTDASGPALYAGGGFTNAGGLAAANVAKWQGGVWTPLGAGATAVGGTVRALASFDDGAGFGARLYAGGDFGVKRWDGASWTAVANGVNGTCRALTLHDDGAGSKLYAGGSFDVVGGVPGATVKKLGPTWTSVGLPLTGGQTPGVFALTSYDDGSGQRLFAGGQFTNSTFVTVGRVARFSGVSWAPMGLGVDLPGSSAKGVFALQGFAEPSGSALYAGGDFNFVDGVVTASLCRWATAVGYPAFTTNPPSYQKIPEGGGTTLTATATGGQPLNYQWFFNNMSLPGENGPTLAIANATYADDGVYTCYATNGCGSQNSTNARVVVESATLVFSYPGVPNGAMYTLTSNQPFAFYFVAFSINSNNAVLPPAGPYLGLAISTSDVVAQFATFALPFVGVTDAFGGATWSSAPDPLPIGAPYVLYGVAVVFDPVTMTVLGRSERASYPII